MKYDVIVIGGGPAGMMAAGRAAENGAKVLLLEKNKSLGKKLLLTGKGRCNITNKIESTKELVEKFGPKGKFLYASFNVFGPDQTIAFFEGRGLKTKVERGGRVFPESDNAKDVLDCLVRYLKAGGVKIMAGAEVQKIVAEGGHIEKLILRGGEELAADNYVIATGGLSYPGTGSTGDGYKWLKDLGHSINELSPALTAISLKGGIPKKLEGLSLKNVEISLCQDNKKVDARFGEAIFTSTGLSGPIVLDLSKEVGKVLSAGKASLKIDFKPALDFKELDARLLKDFQVLSKKMFKNSLDELLPQKMIPVIVELSGISPEKKTALISKEERKNLAHLLKEFTFEVEALDGYSHAIITAGGVELKEVDPGTMKSKIVDNLSIVGEVLDLDGPTGGYNLQVCWSTGQIAGDRR